MDIPTNVHRSLLPADMVKEIDAFFDESIRPKSQFIHYLLYNNLSGAYRASGSYLWSKLPQFLGYIAARERIGSGKMLDAARREGVKPE
jgi:hypothetical protein